MQAIEVRGAARRGTRASDWFRLAMVVAMIGLGLGALLLATANTPAIRGGESRSFRQWVPPAAPGTAVSGYSHRVVVTRGNLPGDDAESEPAAGSLPTHGLLP